MPARQAAGSAANAKRAADDGSGDDEPSAPGPGAKMKLPRLDRGSEDFSSVVKNRLQSYTRTGQACDRCKVRPRYTLNPAATRAVVPVARSHARCRWFSVLPATFPLTQP